MKALILILFLLGGIGALLVNYVFTNNAPVVETIVNATDNLNNEKPDYKTIGGDKDSVVETTILAVESIKILTEKVDELEKNLKNLKDNSANTVKPPNVDVVDKTLGVVDKGKSVVNNLLDNVGVPTKFQISNQQENTGGDNNGINGINSYIWKDSILSPQPISTSANDQQISISNVVANANNPAPAVLPRFTIPANSIFSTINTTALLGRIPVDGQVQDPFRFSLKIKDVGLFANNHKNTELDGVILSGTASGDFLLSCVRASVDSITYIFKDGTISQNDDADMANITDKYGYPCIKGSLVTNAAENIAVVGLLSGLASAAGAIANTERTTTTDPSGNTTSQVTGDNGTYAIYQTLSGSVNGALEYVNERLGSSFDVIVTPAGQDIQLFFNKQVSIDYDPGGRKLVYKNNTKGATNAQFD